MKAFIFDFDGVLVDSERYWPELDRTFFPSIAPLYNAEHAENMMGLGTKAAFAYLKAHCGLTLSFEEYDQQQSVEVLQIYAHKCNLLPGIMELIERLKQKEILLGIASSSRRDWVLPPLKRFGLESSFQTVCTAEDTDWKTKPLPDLYLLAAKKLNVDPHECVALEDSKNGIASAKAAGMYCIGLRTSMSQKQDLSAADKIVSSIDKIELETISL